MKLFIIGTGRSGTHWLADIIGAHPDIVATVEKPPIFHWVTQMASRPELVGQLYPKLVRRYRLEHAAVAPKHYLDKSHPNIWLAESLAESFPDARFVAIRRDVFGTVNSMLKHDGVMSWIHRWREVPLPNRFLGISSDCAEAYDALPLEGKCTVRYKAHIKQLDRLERVLGDRLAIFEYHRLQKDLATELSRISDFLNLRMPVPTPHIKTRSLDKWRQELSEHQQQNISKVLKTFPVYHEFDD